MTARLEVFLADRAPPLHVGSLVEGEGGPWFQYDAAFLAHGLELSKFHTPLAPEPFGPGPRGLHRLRGLLAESIPDGWGLRVLHQVLKSAGRTLAGISSLDLLAAVGDRGMGALAYRPSAEVWPADDALDLERLAAAAAAFDADTVTDALPELRRAAGGTGGARPKVVVAWRDDGSVASAHAPLPRGHRPALVKFRASGDAKDLPLREAEMLALAAKCGLRTVTARTHRLPKGEWALVVDRYDRVGDARRHVQSLASLLEIDIKNDLVDYRSLLQVAQSLTRDYREVEQAFRLAAFNVLAGNRDDHAKNVAFVMEPDGTWRLAPAFDLTPSDGAGGYHAMSVMDESLNPGRRHLEDLGRSAGLDRPQVRRILDEMQDTIPARMD